MTASSGDSRCLLPAAPLDELQMAAKWWRGATETTIDAAGRIVVPKPLRDALGLAPGTTPDLSSYGAGLALVSRGRTARLVEEDDFLVAEGARRPPTRTSSR
jgi:AbrB family looped-hinge helix DNA binding protein